MSSVLVAPVGDHPVVVTAAVDALARLGVQLQEVHVLCPQDELIHRGEEWIELELDCPVYRQDLPFSDANSEAAARQYLQTLALVLERCEAVNHEVHLLLAGGRKNMSALTGVVAQFYPCVRKLYHLLDVYEDDPKRRNFFPVEKLNRFTDEDRQKRMHPEAEAINLFELPFPRIPEAREIRCFLRNPLNQDLPPLPLSADAEAFYKDIFQQRSAEIALEVWLSETAFRRFEDLWNGDRNGAEAFRACFGQMRYPGRLQGRNGMHGTFGDQGKVFHFFKRPHTAERPFYYTLPNPIQLYPGKEVRQVVVCGLSIEQGNGAYRPTGDELLASANREPKYRLSDLPGSNRPIILLVPLGETPMVATQAYTLHPQRDCVSQVVLLYPGKSARISNLAENLLRHFKQEKVHCVPSPIPDLREVGTTGACVSYLKAVADTITDLQGRFPGEEVHLLLSGGRKSMAALNLFAAQQAGLSRVWHTLVRDPDLEHQIDEDLKRAASPAERRDILFLRQYPREQFALFAVPVFPLEEQQ